MSQQHDAPEGGKGTASGPVHNIDPAAPIWLFPEQRAIWSDGYRAGRVLAPTPPAPSGLVDAAEQSRRVLPLIGPLVDAFGNLSNDEKATLEQDHPRMCSHLRGIMAAVDRPPPAPSGLVGAVRSYLAAVDALEDAEAALKKVSDTPFEDWAVAAGQRNGALAHVFATRATLEATLSGQQGGAVPAGGRRKPSSEDMDRMAERLCHFVAGLGEFRLSFDTARRWIPVILRARLAEQPAPAGTGGADRVEGLRKAAEAVVLCSQDGVSIEGYGHVAMLRALRNLRAALDGASGQETTP